MMEYNIDNEKDIVELFHSNGNPMFDDPKFFDNNVEKIPIGMKKEICIL